MQSNTRSDETAGRVDACAALLAAVDRLAADGGDSAALLAVAERALDAAGREVLAASVSDAGLRDSVVRLHRLESAVHGEKLRRLAAVDERQAFLGLAVSAAEWLAQAAALTRAEARTQTDAARALERLPETAAALRAGRLGAGQATEAARTLAELDQLGVTREVAGGDKDGDGRPGDDGDAGGAVLAATVAAVDRLAAVEAAGKDRRALRRDLDALAHDAAGDLLVQRERRVHATRRLWYGTDRDGATPFEGRLDTLGGPLVTTVLDSLARPDGPDDRRTLAQRRADALVRLCRERADRGDLPAVGGQRPHVLLVVTPDTLHDRPDAPPAHLDGVGPVSGATARQVCCDAEVTPILFPPEGQGRDPLRLGRTRRTAGPAARKAVFARDRGCIGCGAPLSRCEVHHIRWWHRDRGATDITNLCAVCWACHTKIHQHGWTVRRDRGNRLVLVPPPGLARPTPPGDPLERDHPGQAADCAAADHAAGTGTVTNRGRPPDRPRGRPPDPRPPDPRPPDPRPSRHARRPAGQDRLPV